MMRLALELPLGKSRNLTSFRVLRSSRKICFCFLPRPNVEKSSQRRSDESRSFAGAQDDIQGLLVLRHGFQRVLTHSLEGEEVKQL